MNSIDRPVLSFGIREEAHFRAVNVAEYKPGFYEFDVLELGEPFAHIRLSVPGYHNIYNALAMCCCVRPLGLKPEDAERAAEAFRGMGRRFEIKGECNGAVIVDDYAHHPTEMAATLKTARSLGYRRVIAVHQPFTYSRTKMLMNDFAEVLSQADQVVLLPVMGGREADDGSVRSEQLAAKLPGSVVVDGLEGAAEWVKQNAGQGDLVVCMSCGDLYKAADMMVNNYRCKGGRPRRAACFFARLYTFGHEWCILRPSRIEKGEQNHEPAVSAAVCGFRRQGGRQRAAPPEFHRALPGHHAGVCLRLCARRV